MVQNSFYDDKDFSYTDYWKDRNYEHICEEMAIKRLIGSKKFSTSVDVGGGFGRLSTLLERYSGKVILIEPSQKMRATAKNYLKNHKRISVQPGNANKTGLPDKSVDLYTSFRVFHHIPDLSSVFTEMKRVLTPDGYLLLEFANSANFKSRIRSIVSGRPLMLTPIEMRSESSIKNRTIAFVNHHPAAVMKIINKSGFKVEKIYSVSNFRSSFIKKLVPLRFLLVLEYLTQSLFSSFYFGPSTFILARRV